MHTRQAFKRRGNMSYEDSRVRGNMRIVCLIMVGAFLLSRTTVADNDVPIGASQYQQRPRPIILEPVMKIKSNNEDYPINWFIKMVSRVIEHPKKPPPSIIGPINLPGAGGQIYIRQVESSLLPWESNHIVIKMMTRDPVTGNNVPKDSSSPYHRPEDPSRRAAKPYGYQPMTNALPRPNNNMMEPGFVPVSPQPHYSPWHAQQRPRYPQYESQYSKPFRASSPNDFRYDNYGKEADRGYAKGHYEDYVHRRPYRIDYQRFTPGVVQPLNAVPLHSMYRSVGQQPHDPDPVYSINDYNGRIKDTRNTEKKGKHFYTGPENQDSPRVTQLPYPEYPGIPDEKPQEDQPVATTETDSVSHVERTSAKPFVNSYGYRQVIRADRMTPTVDRKAKSQTRGSKNQVFREGAKFDTHFDAKNVGGIQVIAAPNLQGGWEDVEKNEEDDNLGSGSRESDSGLNQDEDSIGMRNEKNLARGESAEHSNEQIESQTEESYAPVLRNANSRRSFYKIIDRSHRSQGSQRQQSKSTEMNNSKETFNEKRIENRKNLSAEPRAKAQGAQDTFAEVERNPKINNATAEIVTNLTAGGHWQMQGRRTPRVVKTIYRRKPVGGIIKSSAELMQTSGSSDEKTSKESSKTND